MSDLPALLESIRECPGDRARWLALSGWLRDNGRDDEAVAVRVFWSALRDNVTESRVSLGDTLTDLARNARVLGQVARQVEGRASSPPPLPGVPAG